MPEWLLGNEGEDEEGLDRRDALYVFAAALTDEEWEALEREVEAEEVQSEKDAGLSVFKDKSGRYRWILLSSNAYRDRDGEIVSTKALAQDVARADADRDFGPLRWWHVPGADIGDCDFNILLGRVLVESGTFRSEAIGEAISKAQGTLKASIGFRHPFSEPDREGVFHNIRRFERSLVPAGRAANPFTSLIVQEGDKMTDEEKLAKLKELEELAGTGALESVLEAVKGTHTQAAGVAFKEVTVSDVVTAIKNEDANTLSVGAPSAFTVSASEGVGTGAFSADNLALEVDNGEYAGDLAPDDLVGRIVTAVAQVLAPRMAELGEAVKSLREGRATKDDQIAVIQEQQARKNAADAQALAALHAQQEALATSMKEVSAKIAELAGEAPRAQGYRASQAPDTAINKPDEHRLKEAAPQGIDPNFLGNLMRGTGMTGAVSDDALPPGW